MDYEQQGVFSFLLDQQWLNGSIPADLDEIRAILHLDHERFERVWKRVAPCFELVEGRLVNPRLAREREKRDAYCDSRSENGKQGGRPKKHMVSVCESKTKAKKSFPSPFPYYSENSNSPHECDFEKLKATYPRRPAGKGMGFPKAKLIFAKLAKAGEDLVAIIDGAARYAQSDRGEFTKQLDTWLNQRGWEDEYGAEGVAFMSDYRDTTGGRNGSA